jgi:hypothetical protein
MVAARGRLMGEVTVGATFGGVAPSRRSTARARDLFAGRRSVPKVTRGNRTIARTSFVSAIRSSSSPGHRHGFRRAAEAVTQVQFLPGRSAGTWEGRPTKVMIDEHARLVG